MFLIFSLVLNPVGKPFLTHHVDKSIAKEVQLLITSGAVGLFDYDGKAHVTFIVNGHKTDIFQPNCPLKRINLLEYLNCCCHTLAHDIFVLSLMQRFLGYYERNWKYFGPKPEIIDTGTIDDTNEGISNPTYATINTSLAKKIWQGLKSFTKNEKSKQQTATGDSKISNIIYNIPLDEAKCKLLAEANENLGKEKLHLVSLDPGFLRSCKIETTGTKIDFKQLIKEINEKPIPDPEK